MESNTLNEPGITKHHGGCTIYMMLSNPGRPEAGICTCGYGMSLVRRKGNWSQMYSAELGSLLNSKTHQRAQTQERADTELVNVEPNEIKLTFGEEIIRINPTGFHYRGELVKDAGECHRLLLDFLRRTMVSVGSRSSAVRANDSRMGPLNGDIK